MEADTRPPAALWCFAYIFCLLCSYYILRPVREEMDIRLAAVWVVVALHLGRHQEGRRGARGPVPAVGWEVASR